MKATVNFYNESGKNIAKTIRTEVRWSTGMTPASRRTLSLDFEVPLGLRRPYSIGVYLSVPELMRIVWFRLLGAFDWEDRP